MSAPALPRRAVLALVGAGALAPALVPGARALARNDMTFEWIATYSAPQAYPAFILDGDLWWPGGSVYIPDNRVAATGWGVRGAIHITGEPARPAPERLTLTWYCVVQDRFWTIDAPLPAARIAALMAEGVAEPETGARIGYDSVIVGMAPGGAVAVWLGAGILVHEVALFRAAPTERPWTDVLDNPDVPRDDYRRIMLAETIGEDAAAARLAEGVPPRMMETRHARWPILPEITGEGVPDFLTVTYWNGEVEPFVTPGAAPAHPTRAAPRSAEAGWRDGAGRRISAAIAFDRDEMAEALAAVCGEDRAAPASLDFRIEEGGASIRVALRGAKKAWRFRGLRIETWER